MISTLHMLCNVHSGCDARINRSAVHTSILKLDVVLHWAQYKNPAARLINHSHLTYYIYSLSMLI